MGLVLLKGVDGAYRRRWYAAMREGGKRTTRALSTPLRGKIPLDPFGRFSLELEGDIAFEKSKENAKAELSRIIEGAREAKSEEAKAPGYIEKAVYRKITGSEFHNVLLRDLADENAKRGRYKYDPADKRPSHARTVHCILTSFAEWVKTNTPGAKHITDVNAELVRAYYASIRQGLSWETFSKRAFTLGSTFAYFMPTDCENPFRTVFGDDYAKDGDKSSEPHQAPTDEQLERIFAYTKSRADKRYLHRLAVLAACSGLRIGDCANLKWQDIDLVRWRIKTRPAKTKHLKKPPEVTINIFDHDAASADYHPVFGELRREIEAALAEPRRRGEQYFIPEAARIYAANPTRLNKEGKTIFARALAPTAEHVENAVLVGEEREQLSPAQILEAIDAAGWTDAKRERIRRVYECHAQGWSYSRIAAAIGKSKGSISDDLLSVEDLTGQRIRTGESQDVAAAHGIRTLLKATRRERGKKRAACIFGWHSLRSYFATRCYRDGVPLEAIETAVGHGSARMLLNHYLRTKAETDADEVREMNRQRNRQRIDGGRTPAQIATENPRTPHPALPEPKTGNDPAERLAKLEGLFSRGLITADERERERARILAEI